MRVKTILYFIIYLTLTFSCRGPIKYPKMDQKTENLWLYLSIKANNLEYYMDAFTDSLFVKKGDTLNPRKSFKILKSEKDSLFTWTETLIDTKIILSRFCTDYYGKLSLRIAYSEQMSKQINYSSICEWEELDSNTRKIYELLDRIENTK